MAEPRRAPTNNPTISAPSVRRNLFFASQASRSSTSSVRPAPANLAEGTTDANTSEMVVRNADGGYQFPATPPPPTENPPTAEQEAEMKLSEMLSNRSRETSDAELLNAIKASLRRKVASLDHDRWMFTGQKSS